MPEINIVLEGDDSPSYSYESYAVPPVGTPLTILEWDKKPAAYIVKRVEWKLSKGVKIREVVYVFVEFQ